MRFSAFLLSCSADMESSGKDVPAVLPTLRGKKEVEGKQAVPTWMLAKEVDAKDRSVAGYIQRTKNVLFGGLQQDIFAVWFVLVKRCVGMLYT
jgi:hypothetical protein